MWFERVSENSLEWKKNNIENKKKFSDPKCLLTETVFPKGINVKSLTHSWTPDDCVFKLLPEFFVHKFMHKANENH